MKKEKEPQVERNLKKVLKQVIWNPKRSDREIANAIGISQPTVSRAIRKIQKKKLAQFIGVPDFQKIGYEIMAFSFLKKTKANLDTLERIIGTKEPENIVFAIESLRELVVISLHENCTHYLKWIGQFELSQDSAICPTTEIVADLDFSGLKILRDLK